MADNPEVLISDNPHGIMFFGPGGEDDDGVDDDVDDAVDDYLLQGKSPKKNLNCQL